MSSETASGGCVLVVEDDPALRMLCRVNLELEHYLVLEAGTLETAEQLLGVEPVDLVLLDLHVGDRHGLELVPIIQRERPNAGICLLSGTSETEPPEREGVDAFIRKPFELDELLATIRRLLAQRRV